MYRQTKFSEILYKIREQISQQVDFDAMKLARTLITLYQSDGLTIEREQKEETQKKKSVDVICEKRSS
jgi:hypothetical protein